MSLDSSAQSMVASAIKAYGRPATVTREANAEGAYNPATGEVEGGNAAEFSTVCSVSMYRRDSQDGSIKRGDLKVVIPAKDAGFTPRQNDRIKVDGVNYKVLWCNVLQGTQSAIAYELQARGGAA